MRVESVMTYFYDAGLVIKGRSCDLSVFVRIPRSKCGSDYS